MESLEDRCLPSILFGDTPGLTTSDNGGPVLANAQVRLVFWGSGWFTNGTLETQMQNEVDTLNGSTYFYSPFPGADLSQYRPFSAARPTRVGSFVVSPFSPSPFDYQDPGTTVNPGDVANMLSSVFGMTPNFYYYVVPQPGSAPPPGIAALHSYWSQGLSNEYYGYSLNPSSGTHILDQLTVLYGHEMAESIGDPAPGQALVVTNPPPGVGNEISDGEAQNYIYRLNGVLVQPYWSQQDGKFTVPTGQNQNFYVSSSGVLTVNGDQLGVNFNDTITLDVVNGGVFVNLNGETAQFEPGTISSIVVNTGGGADTVKVYNTDVPVTINGGGSDTVNIGNGSDGVQGILGTINIENPPNFNTITVDDSADGTAHNATLGTFTPFGDSSWGFISGLAPAHINYEYADTTRLTVKTGTGGNILDVLATGVTTNLIGSSGGTTVNVGNAGSVLGILGTLNIENPPSYDTITVDDSADGTPHPSITLSTLGTNPSDSEGNTDPWGQITGLAPAPINYEYFDTTSLTVKTGTGGNTVDVLATGSLFGPGNRTTTLIGSSGGTTVNVGNAGTLTNILGALNIENETSLDTVNINDQNDTTSQNNATLSTVKGSTLGQLSGLVGAGGPIAPISWDYPDTAQVTINTGQAGITLTVLGTGVPTFINGNSAGTNTLVGGNLQTTWHVNTANAGTLSNALASVTFTNFQNLTSGYGGDGFIFANLATLSGTLNGGGGSGLSLAPYLTSLTVNITGGGIGNIPGVVGAFQGVQYLTTGSGNDSFIFGNAGSITSISSVGGINTLDASAVNRSLSVSVYGTNAGTVPGMVFEFADIENFIGGSHNNTYVFSNGASLAGTLNGGSATNLIDMSPYITGLTFSVSGANSGSVAGVVGSFNHVQNLLGAGGGGNVFALSPGGSLAGELDGGFGGSNLLDYSAYTTGVTVNLSLNSATAVSGGVVNIQELRGGAGNDHLTGNGAGGTTFFASPGTDTIIGLGSGNTLVGANTTNLWSITGLDSGTLNTSSYTDIENLVGGTGLDTFKFKTTGKESSIIGGGAPLGQGDWLDYSAFTAANPVNVNLLLDTATNVSGSISGIQNVIGGAGNDILTGDSQGNILIEHGGAGTINGGLGRSLLIRGTGAATVNGGSSGDLLIGGKTSYDTTNHLALMAILAEWQSADPYLGLNSRTDKISDGSLPGGARLFVGVGGTVTLSTGGVLNGAPGSDFDWFFMTSTQAHSVLEPGEIVTSSSATNPS